jgi:hypothetical protein
MSCTHTFLKAEDFQGVEFHIWVNIATYISETSQPTLTVERQEDRIHSFQKPNELRPKRITFLKKHVSCKQNAHY